ncbi:unnamed protein product [Toxocara canis]|uniref:Thioredoxin-like_fold domain-containing protein n=1 Tax=Toxocara canis TaxID=6265 RepID=A0A183V7E4_TOXCA|nr:unnamed protein product [Toxocara canis]
MFDLITNGDRDCEIRIKATINVFQKNSTSLSTRVGRGLETWSPSIVPIVSHVLFVGIITARVSLLNRLEGSSGYDRSSRLTIGVRLLRIPECRDSLSALEGIRSAVMQMWSAAATFIVIAAIAAVNSQMVNVTLFTEAQCKYCTKLFREQLWPFYTQHPGVMNLQVVAFGKGNCELYPDRKLHCYCMHGPTDFSRDIISACWFAFKVFEICVKLSIVASRDSPLKHNKS